MATLLDRFSTYDDGWCVSFLKPIEMAKAGFSYFGIQDQVKCYFCSKVLDSWQEGDDPLNEHRLHSPQCLFVCATKSDDIQVITLEDRLRTFVDKWSLEFLKPIQMAKAGFAYLGIQDRVKCLSCWNDFEDWDHGDDPLAKHTFQSPQCPFVLESTNDLQKTMLKDRLKTFDDGWSVQFLKPVDMAKAGFIYLGIQDHVKCLSCSKDFHDWQKNEDPLVKHLVQSPQCPFLRDPKISYDVCGPYSSEPSGAYIEANQIQDCLDSVGIIHKLELLTYPEFINLDARLKSFDKCLVTLVQDINTLCEAGFFYKGNGTDDKMTCFYCNLVLYNWDNKDEPWTEHARYSKNCSYLLLKTGKIFVDKVHGVESDITKSNIIKLVKLIAKYGDTYIVGTSMKIKSTKKILDSLQNTNLSEIKISFDENQHLSRTRNSNTIPEYMLCKICYKEEIAVAFVTCGHTIACIQCALTIVQCAVCRHPFNKAMRVYLSTDKDPKLVSESSSKGSDSKLDSTLCKVCHKEDKVAVFIPCRHVYACAKCAEEIEECPVCTENVCSFIQLHI